MALISRLMPVETGAGLIRLGPEGDGGYLVPDDLDGIEACFSPGVNDVSGFERACADRGVKAFLADRSVEGPAEANELFHFTRKFVGSMTNDEFMTLDGWVAASGTGPDSDLMLQIDIEGFEYEVFLSASEALLRRFRIIVAEFHMLDQLWNKPFYDLAGRTFEKILQTHACVHIHPNNCCGTVTAGGITIPRIMEFTFLRHDRVHSSRPATTFPHPLDHDNTDGPTIVLPKSWHATS